MLELPALAKCLQISPGFGRKKSIQLLSQLVQWNICRTKTLSILSNTGVYVTLHSFPSSLFHHSSSIQYIHVSSYLSNAKKSFYLFIVPVIHYAYSFIETLAHLFDLCLLLLSIPFNSWNCRLLPLIHFSIIYLSTLFTHILFLIIILSWQYLMLAGVYNG